MPFDGTEIYDGHPLAKLGAVERLLATEQQWCKGRLRDAHGRHCLVGAIEAVGGRQVLQKVVLQAAREVSGKRYWRIEFFNDDPRTTHTDVLQVLRRARQNIIAGMINEYDRQPRYRKWLRAMGGRWSRPAAGLSARLSPVETERLAGTAAAQNAEPQIERYTGSAARKDRALVLELQE